MYIRRPLAKCLDLRECFCQIGILGKTWRAPQEGNLLFFLLFSKLSGGRGGRNQKTEEEKLVGTEAQLGENRII